MSILSFLSKKNKKNKQYYKQVEMMSGNAPVFNNFGNDIYASDIIQHCIHCITSEIGKLEPRHIYTNNTTEIQSIVNNDINRLFKYGANPLMTTTEFLEAITYLREKNKNVFIFLKYSEVDYGNGYVGRRYKGFYPLNPTTVEFLQDSVGKIFIKFQFGNFETYTIPYEDIIIWRKDYGANEFLGGDAYGNPNNEALLKLVKADSTIIQGVEKAVKVGFNMNGIVKLNTLLTDEKQVQEVKKFEDKLRNSESGIIPLDTKCEYIPLKLDPKIIDKETLQFIETRILNNYGISLPIFNGDFTEEQYQAFYEKTLESMILGLGRLFTKALFTQKELDAGNEVIFYAQGLLFTNLKNKIDVVDMLSNRGVLTDNQILNIFGYPPFEGGDIRHISLNYINRNIADQYQLEKFAHKEDKKNE